MVNYGINKYTYTGDIMEYKRINLDYNSLEPYIDNKTLDLHYNSHYKNYTDNLNKYLNKHNYKYNHNNNQSIFIYIHKLKFIVFYLYNSITMQR